MRTFLLPAFLVAAHTLSAQWTGNPAAPLAICDAPSSQNVVQARPDGAGGSYVFWQDNRNGRREIWGQHVTADGLPLWAPNGQALLALPGGRHVSNYFAASMENGGVFIAYVQAPGPGGGDTVRFARFDVNGASLIEPHPLVGGRTTQQGSFSCEAIALLVRPDGSAFVSWSAGGRRLNAVAADGSVPQGYDGVLALTTNGLAPHKLVPDGAGGVIVASMHGNANTPVRLQRFNFQLEAQWPDALVLPPQPGHNVNSFGLESIGADGFFVSWRATAGQPGDLFVARFGNDGVPAWANVEKPICSGAQASDHRMVMGDGHLLAAWRRQGVQSRLYAQKLTLDGDLLWPVDGALVEPFPSNVGAPRIAGLPDGGAMITSNGNVYAGHRLDASGQVLWPEAATMANGSYQPETSWYDLLGTADNGAVSFWHGNSTVFGARVLPTGELAGPVGIDEHGRSLPLAAWPVPAGDVLYMRLPAAHAPAAITVHTTDGRSVHVPFAGVQGEVLQLDLEALPPGMYVAQVIVGTQRHHARFVKE